MQITNADGAMIYSMDDWFRLAPPKRGELQWKNGRSAKELARAWFPEDGARSIPAELIALLKSVKEFEGVELQRGEAERKVSFDDIPRAEKRNSDMVIVGRFTGGRIAISVEAKADESFDRPVSDCVAKALQRSKDSRLPERIRRLARGLFGTDDASWMGELQYQLINATGATLAYAGEVEADAAVFVVHEFVTDMTEDRKHAENATALDKFANRLTAQAVETVAPGQMHGPFHVPGNEHIPGGIPLYFGKCTRNIRKNQPQR
jgi:hypothetical protein